jgi:hypothetical protein
MATVANTVAGRIEVVKWPTPENELTLLCAADISAGTFVRQDANGKWIQALATSAANLLGARYALRSAKTGEALTAARKCTVGGLTVTQAFNVNLFVSDTGTLADTAGTTSQIAGRVVPGTANDRASAHDKLVEIDLPE